MNELPWVVPYDSPNDPRLGVKYGGSNISANDGDICISFITHSILSNTKNPYCLDIGADECWWAIFCNEHFPTTRIDAFEPMPISPSFLENLKKNYPLITLHNKAVSNTPGFLSLSPQGPTSHSREDSEYKVQAITLDSFLETAEKVDLIKIDTEGHEIHILENLLKYKDKLNAVIFELTMHWYADEEYEAIHKTYPILCKLYSVLPYAYFVSRRGEPQLIQITEDEILPFIKNSFIRKYQCDLFFSKTPFGTTPSPS